MVENKSIVFVRQTLNIVLKEEFNSSRRRYIPLFENLRRSVCITGKPEKILHNDINGIGVWLSESFQ